MFKQLLVLLGMLTVILQNKSMNNVVMNYNFFELTIVEN